MQLTDRQTAYLRLARRRARYGQRTGVPAMAAALGWSEAKAQRTMRDLVAAGLLPLRDVGDNRPVPWVQWPSLPAGLEWVDADGGEGQPGSVREVSGGAAEASGVAVSASPAESVATALLARLQKQKDQAQSISDLADSMDLSPRRIREAVAQLEEQGYNVFVEGDHLGLTREDEPAHETAIPTDGVRIRFGAVSDTHLCSKRERLDVLNTLYDWFADEGVQTVYHGGNWIEGEARFNVREIHTFGLEAQVAYFLREYPRRSGITTHIVSGDDHEGWYQQREGISIGRYMELKARDAGREDLVHLGYMEHDIAFRNEAGQFVMRVMHPGGGSAYALSYRPQKIVESFAGGEKPAVLLLGHYHKLEYLPAIRNVRVVQLGCTADQSVWARKKPIEYQLGGWLIELVQCPKSGACIGAKFEERTFFNREFYRQWEDAA